MSGVRPGSRVYWHGIFPDPTKQATVKRPGKMRHEILWDGSDTPVLVGVTALAKVLRGRPVCPYAPDSCGYCVPPIETER